MTKLEEFMKENCLSKKELANMCDVKVSVIKKLIDGINFRNALTPLFKISIATKIRADDLIAERRKVLQKRMKKEGY